MIPGPDPGACPECGGWRKAGMFHSCEDELRHRERWVEALVELTTLYQEASAANSDARNGALKFGGIKYMYRDALVEASMMLSGVKEGDPREHIEKALAEGSRLEEAYWEDRRLRMAS